MGTAFYVREPRTRLHGIMRVEPPSVVVGKNSKGWTFTYAGDRENGVKDVASWKSWVLSLIGAGGELVNEYGKPVTFTELVELAESKRNAPNKNAVLYPNSSECFLDADGNDFVEGNWS